jgi:hypothetical protein
MHFFCKIELCFLYIRIKLLCDPALTPASLNTHEPHKAEHPQTRGRATPQSRVRSETSLSECTVQ